MKKILGTMFPLKHCLSYALKVPKKKPLLQQLTIVHRVRVDLGQNS